MKFGKNLLEMMDPEWAVHYVDYKKMKGVIKAIVENGGVTAPAGSAPAVGLAGSLTTLPGEGNGAETVLDQGTETEFYRVFDEEVAKVDAFARLKGEEIRYRIQQLEGQLASELGRDGESNARFLSKADEIGTEFLRLESYVNLNNTAVHKILKKHDKKIPERPCSPIFLYKLRTQEWVTGRYQDIIIRLSAIHAAFRNETSGVASKTDGKQEFVRKTTKYWVRMEDVSKIKWMVLRHLPVFQFTKSNNDSQLINSVYLDNDHLELCHARLDKTPQALAVRLRWYDDAVPTKEVFVERKTHRDAWTGEESVKERFTIKTGDVMPFLNGTISLEDKVIKMRKKQKSEKEIKEFSKLSREILNVVRAKRLGPTVRTQYHRTAFQIPFDARVRVSLDTNLAMILETNPDEDKWYRDPTRPLSPDQITRFPFAVVEVKLQTASDGETPAWVQDLLNTGLLKEIHKFSKFIHGCSMLMRDNMRALPYWLSDPELVEFYEKLQKKRKDSPTLKETTNVIAAMHKSRMTKPSPAATCVSEMSLLNSRKPASSPDLKEPLLCGSEPSPSNSAAKDPAAGPWKVTRGHTYSTGRPIGPVGHESEHRGSSKDLNCLCLPKRGLPTKIPMKVEPKVFFANERTFLSWLGNAVTLGSIASALLHLGAQKKEAYYTGIMLIPVSIMFVLYALWTFLWRASKIRAREDANYDDRFGPTMLCAVFVAAMSTTLVMSLGAFDV